MDTDDFEQQQQPSQPMFGAAAVGVAANSGTMSNSSANSNDIVQSLLQQFNCLGTTDHDVLVTQMLQILGYELSFSTAKFFLDMNNWNLQAAVGCYFDAYNNQRLPSMQIVADVTVGNGESVTPNTKFTKSWKLVNSGEETWPEGCYLKVLALNNDNVDTAYYINHIQSNNNNNLDDFHRINLAESTVAVPAIRPGNHTVCTVQLFSPTQVGSFQVKFRLCTPNGNFFGDTVWAIVCVAEAGTLALTQQLSNLHATSGVMSVADSPGDGMLMVEMNNNNNTMTSNNMQLSDEPANNEFLFRPGATMMALAPAPQNPPGTASASSVGGSTDPGGQAMDAVDLIPTNFN